MHTGVSGCGHFLVKTDEEAIDLAKRYLSFMPGNWREEPPAADPAAPASEHADRRDRPRRREPALRHAASCSTSLLDADSFLPVHKRWAKELIVGYGRLDGRVVGVVANQPQAEGRRPLRRLGRQGGPLHPDLQRLQRAAALPRRRARLHDRHRGRAPGDHPPRGEDDQRRLRSDRAEDLGHRAQGLRRRPLRDGRARPSSPTAASPCPAPRSR